MMAPNAAIQNARLGDIDAAEKPRGAADHRAHAGHAADEKVERDFPRPDGRADDRFARVAGFALLRLLRDGAAGNVHAATADCAVAAGFFAQGVETSFGGGFHVSGRVGVPPAASASRGRSFSMMGSDSEVRFGRMPKPAGETPTLPGICSTPSSTRKSRRRGG